MATTDNTSSSCFVVEGSCMEGLADASNSMFQVEQDRDITTGSSSQHIHFHMHMHAVPPFSSQEAGLQHKAGYHHHCDPNSANDPFPAFIKPSAAPAITSRQQQAPDPSAVQSALTLAYPTQQQQQQGMVQDMHCPWPTSLAAVDKQQQHSAVQHAGAFEIEPKQQKQRARRSRRVRPLLRVVLLSTAATAAVLAGAGAAVVVLSPRVEQLECRCLEMLQRNQQLEEHTSSLAASKQQLGQQLEQLAAAKAQLDAQVAALQQQQGGLAEDNQALKQQLHNLHGSQQQLQEAAEKLQVQVAAATEKLERTQQQQQQQQQEEGAGRASVAAAASLPVAPSGVAPAPGDLSVQVTVPGFTDALVSRISEADLVPQFAQALVGQVKQSNLIGHAVELLLARLGQQLSGLVCPWKWNISLPKLGQQQRAGSGSSGSD